MLESNRKVGNICLFFYILFLSAFGFECMIGGSVYEITMRGIEAIWVCSMAFTMFAIFWGWVISSDTSLRKDILMYSLYGLVLYGVNYLMFVKRDYSWILLYVIFMLLMKWLIVGIKYITKKGKSDSYGVYRNPLEEKK